ncbi:Predicted dienelactone hydrolase [Bradyrhizobium lablabi]|uniref:Predicted dienelactone hydrolase n=1 Tax=Bradyrhizobium lablabi TaxID=722472 RepID=A0A1M6I166_9BRAD|nr:alpha/beta fold hydrolase [Bradyrhizobium lablabi]SHJ28155.1 Predicted dienelactone hydrolase [Bradyrhizobium lablabi]
MVLKKYFAYALLLCCLASPAEAAGIQLLDSDPGLAGAIWYPCAGEPKDVPLGKLAVPPDDIWLTGAKDCPVTGAKLPLVIFSHGRGGWFVANHDTAEALADAGFVVAAINHPGDNGNDSSQRDKMSVWASRPADMVRLLDFMLHDWKDKVVIDPARIGFFGFSLGGYTGLVLVGAHADFRRFALICKETDKTENCERARSGDVPPSPPHDPRIRAAVLADAAMNFAFTPEALSGIQVPLQIWRSELGGNGVDARFTALTASQLPGQPEIHTIPAGHYAFLAPCSPLLATRIPRICTDVPAGFDRAAFHHDFDASVVRFFREHLVSDGGTR